ncbi:hypothetical protein KY320_04235 [Candidatus Woesearchaeota archaeon]|nr:hypothetical protein [Candidatus Woesearchaeota archaeon]
MKGGFWFLILLILFSVFALVFYHSYEKLRLEASNVNQNAIQYAQNGNFQAAINTCDSNKYVKLPCYVTVYNQFRGAKLSDENITLQEDFCDKLSADKLQIPFWFKPFVLSYDEATLQQIQLDCYEYIKK